MEEKIRTAGDNYEAVTHRVNVRVLYADTDAMGVVYYANYLRYFETGRMELFRSLGITLESPEIEGFVFPAAEAHCRYLASARADDLLTVETTLDTENRASLRFDYRVFREGGELLATGHTLHACVEKEGRVTRTPKALRERLDRACAFVSRPRLPRE
jgi:acyl-CoA thioester hydrolase